jgi:hypothetical protein
MKNQGYSEDDIDAVQHQKQQPLQHQGLLNLEAEKRNHWLIKLMERGNHPRDLPSLCNIFEPHFDISSINLPSLYKIRLRSVGKIR